MPSSIVVSLSAEEQALFLAQLRQARYGHLLTLHILLLLHHGLSPTDIARCLFCSRSSVYRSVAAWRRGAVTPASSADLPRSWWASVLADSVRQKLDRLLRSRPDSFGWLRSRWNCVCLAVVLSRDLGQRISAETVRRWLHQTGFVCKRVSLVGRDDDPQRAWLLARIRLQWEDLATDEAYLFADELDVHLLPKVGAEWTRRGERVELVTPGKNQRAHVAAALDFCTGQLWHRTGAKKNRFLFLDLLAALNRAYPVGRYRRVFVVVDNYSIHSAHDVRDWLARHPRIVLLWLPRYCPAANPIERVFGDLHDQITRNHRHHTLLPLMREVQCYLRRRVPCGALPSLYDEPPITSALRQLRKKAA